MQHLHFFILPASTIAGDDDDEEEEGGKSKIKFAPLAVFCTFFVAELGDKTQLTAITFGANEGMSAALIVWIGCSLGLFAADILGMLVGYLLKSKTPDGLLNTLGICNILCIWCIHALSGTETDRSKCLSHPCMAGADSCNSGFCCFMCLSFYKKREEKQVRKYT